MKDFNFDLQRFVELEATENGSVLVLSMGETYTYNNVIYTAQSEQARINLDSSENLAGLASGIVKATTTNGDDPTTITFDATNGAVNFSATGDETFDLTLANRTFKFSKGNVTVTSGGVTMDNAKFSVAGTRSAADYEFVADAPTQFFISADSFTITSEKMSVIISTGGGQFATQLSGTATRNFTNQTFTFTEGTSISTALGSYTLSVTAADELGGGLSLTSKGITFTPADNTGALGISILRDGTSVISNNLSISNGGVFFNPTNNTIGVTAGTVVSAATNDYSLSATATGDTTTAISLTDSGILFTPNTGDGALQLTLGSAKGSMTAEVEVLSGGFLFGNDGTFNVAKDTELQIKFSDDYIVNFKATDNAGGAISLGENGITFTPNEGDGGLQLSVTRNGETRTASLNVNGSLTYNLDGSISLAKGTVVKNVFEDGTILAITAKTDANGAITFNPLTGLTITPATADALDIALTRGDVTIGDITSIMGTINYNGGVITASDGSALDVSYYNGEYNIHIQTTGGSSVIQFDGDRVIGTAGDGATLALSYPNGVTWNINSNSTLTKFFNAEAILSEGTNFSSNDTLSVFTLEKAGNYTINGMSVTAISNNVQVQLANYDTIIVDGISYTPLDGNVKLTLGENGATASGGKVNLQMSGFESVFGFDLTDGGVSYSNGKFTVHGGAKSYLGNGSFPTQFVAQSDFSIQVTPREGGLYSFTLPDGAAAVSVVNNGVTILSPSVSLSGELLFNPETHEMTLTKGSVITSDDNGNILTMTALEDAGGQLTVTDSGIRFAPNENDGALQLNFVSSSRSATLNVSGAFVYSGSGQLSLEDGTTANLTWEDGTALQLKSHGSSGSVGIDPQRGFRITSNDENLDMTLTTPYMSTEISGIKGTIYYNAGNVSFDENSKITATTTLGGQPMYTTLETIGGTGHISFSATQNGIVYAADTGALRVTWSRNDLESTFTVNSGSVQIGHGLFEIAEGSNIATDLKNFVSAFYFTTGDAGEYTINGQTITTTARNLALTATDNQMVFKTSDDVVKYDGMTFAGSGNVTLTPAAVALGNGVVATGFGAENTFILNEQGIVTADEKVFELTEDVTGGISVKGAENGFIFSRTLTQESEERLGYYNSPDIGKVFSEEFHSAGDNSYRIETDLIGLEKVSGISDGATITGGATLDGENTLSYYVLETDTNGKFTIGEKTYTLAEGNTVGTEIRAYFNEGAAYADRINNLNGTVSGDFTAGTFKINGGSSMQVFGDTDVSIHANENGYEIFGLDDGASLKVLDSGTYVVNSTTLESSGTNFIVGNSDGTARLLYENYFENENSGNVITGTEGNDAIYNTGANTRINALGGNDTITNTNVSNAYINAGDGDNVITENLNYEIANINGQDTLLNYYENNTIVAGAGNDYIYNKGGYYLSVASGAGNDTIRNIHGYYPTINTGAGDDSIVIEQGHYQYVDAGDGNDSIIGSFASGDWAMGGHATLVGGNGNDYIDAIDTNDASILGGQGNDTILVSATTASENPTYIDGGEGDDYIQNANDNSQIYAGEGNNNIDSYGSNVTITAGMGNDTISNKVASNVLINVGDGDNVITEILDYEVANVEGKDTLINYYENSTIIAGSGNDSIYNEGGYYLNLETGDGNDTVTNIHGYYPTISTGAGDDSVVIGKGHYQNINTGDGNDVIIGSIVSGGWAMGGHASIDGGSGDDYIDTGYTNDSKILGGDGNDTIITTGTNSTIDGGAGANLIRLTTSEGTTRGTEYIVMNGQTTVEGFKTGFGDGTDTLYTEGDYPSVDFRENGLTFYDSENSVTFSDINHTAQVNMLYAGQNDFELAVFIANDEWYDVTNGTAKSYVGATATKNHGIDFSGVTSDVNVTLNTDYSVLDAGSWIENVHSIKGGAGNTTITGSTDNDTIFAGTGATTINAGAGDDYIVLNSEANNYALINYTPDEGNDTIIGFGANDTLKVDGEAYSVKSGNDLIVTVGDSRITLVDAANLSNPNIAADKNPLVELTEVILKRTEAGYPVMAAIAFSPEEVEVEPTNYAAKEDWNITSSDNLNIHAVHYTPENSNDKWVVLIHGYGNNHTAMYPYLSYYMDNGYNVLMIDQRAAGESEGEWLTMGTAESADVALWTQEIARRNANAKITLHGVSMGAATAMLAAARSDAVNITSIVEDCGYSNVMDTFSLVNDAVLHQPTEVIQALDPVSASLTGYYLHDAAPINSISSVTVPSLFISGSEDTVAPVSMLSALYEASGAEVKGQYIVDGAPHARSISYDPAGYANVLFSFIAEADGEGVDIDNETDSIYLRGTSYNDTISTSGTNVTIDAGAGENIVKLSGDSETVIFSGKTTVEGFTTGFGDGADALYIKQSPPGVDFSENGLTFLSSTDSVTFSDIHHTAKIDLYHTQNPQVTLASAVVIARDEWYTVTDNDLAIRNDYKQGLYFVGGTTTANQGVDFSNIAQDLNVTVDTEYELEDVHLWINNVHSIKGGAGNTTITGSTDNDTIFAGGGQSSLWGGKGNDYLEGGAGYDTFIYELGDGNDTVTNAGAGDLIFLSNISLEQILSANINAESVALSLSDGGSINISGADEIYQLANGSRYSVDREKLEWKAI